MTVPILRAIPEDSLEVRHMRLNLTYGPSQLPITVEDSRIAQVLNPSHVSLSSDLDGDIRRSLETPTGTPPLRDMVSAAAPQKVAVLVGGLADGPVPAHAVAPVLDALAEGGVPGARVTVLIANGLRKPHPDDPGRTFLATALQSRCRMIVHSPEGREMATIGKITGGLQLRVNRIVAEADFIVTIGTVIPHPFSGYTGWRDAILPGVAEKRCIEAALSRFADLPQNLPAIDRNPVHLEMVHAARRADVDFAVNICLAGSGDVASVVSGAPQESWNLAIRKSGEYRDTPFGQQTDVVIVAAGGSSVDRTAALALRVIHRTLDVLRPGGTLVIVAECAEGLGDRSFERWLKEAENPETIVERFRKRYAPGGVAALIAARLALDRKLLLVSSLDVVPSALAFAEKAPSVEAALDIARKLHGPDFTCTVIPDAKSCLPVPAGA
jgi:nickel-dependent lactate racemase